MKPPPQPVHAYTAPADHISQGLAEQGKWWLAAISALYWFCALRRSAFQPYIFDELCTWRIATMPTVRNMWDAIMGGADQHLIGTHLLVRLSHSLLGDSHISSRLPGAIGVWVMFLCLYALLKRFVPVPFALAGALLPFLTFIWQFAYQARAYGILLGAASCALLCWQIAAERAWGRMLPLLGLTLSLMVALSCNLVALTIGLPLVAAELVRTMERRRIDWPIWIALAAATPPIVMYPGVLAITGSFKTDNLYPRLDAIPLFYAEMLQTAVFPLLAAAIAAWLVARGAPAQPKGYLPRPLAAAFLSFAALPALWVIAGYLSRHFFFTSRYGAVAVIGVAGLFAFGACHAFARAIRQGAVILLVFTGWMVISRGMPAIKMADSPARQFASSIPLLRQTLRGDVPVIVPEILTFARADHYLPADELRQVHFVIDFDNAWRTPGRDIDSHMIWGMRTFHTGRANVDRYSEFVQRYPKFLLWTNDEPPEWLYWDLFRDKYSLRMIARTNGESIFLVESRH